MTRHSDSHTDHVSDEILAYVLQKYEGREEFFVETFELPGHLPEIDCALYGPACGDEPIKDEECVFENRPGRNWVSRLVNRPVRKTRTCTVVAGPYENNKCVLYTVYGGPIAAKEPNDPNIQTGSVLAASAIFWSTHALARIA